MEGCKLCGNKRVVLNGHSKSGQQRYKCRACDKTFGKGDARVKYDLQQRLRVLRMYLEGIGMRSIERLENISTPLIIKWIRGFASMVRREMQSVEIPEDIKNIEILEIDELFTYCQKNFKKSTYGLLLIGTEIKLLQLK
jgi:transposase-like protein